MLLLITVGSMSDSLLEVEDLIRATAYHEAGHAAIGWYFRKPIREQGVFVNFDRPGEGNTHTHGTLVLPLARLPEALRRSARRHLRAECIEFLAGYVAENRGMKRRGASVLGNDAIRATMLVMRAYGCIQAVAELHLHGYARATGRLVRNPAIWPAIDALAQRLMNQGRLSGCEVEVLFAERGLRRVSGTYFRNPGRKPVRNA